MSALVNQPLPQPQQEKEIADLLAAGRDLYGRDFVPYQGLLAAARSVPQHEAEALARRQGTDLEYLQRAERLARQSEASFPEHHRRYMNPYENHVVRNVTEDINRNFRENILPALESKFLRAGQHGASGHRRLAQQAQRDMQTELLARLGQLRAHGYELGAKQHEAQQNRLAQLADLTAGFGRQRQASRIADIGALQEVGGLAQQTEQNMQDAAYHQWLRGQAWPFERFQMRQAMLSGLPFHTGNMQIFREAPQARLNSAGNLSSLAMALLGARRKGMFGS
jgi:hypothetical protein